MDLTTGLILLALIAVAMVCAVALLIDALALILRDLQFTRKDRR